MTHTRITNVATDLGVLEGVGEAQNNWVRLQSFIDHLKTEQASEGVGSLGFELYFPACKLGYFIDRPLLCDVQNLSLRGDGMCLSSIRSIHPHDILVFGLRRDAIGGPTGPQTLNASFFEDGSGVTQNLGRTLFALRTRGSAFGYFQGTPLDRGEDDYASWGNTKHLTIDFFVSSHAGWTLPQGVRLFGIGAVDQDLQCFSCVVNPDSPVVGFDFLTNDGGRRRAEFNLPSKATMDYRISLQLDLVDREVAAYVDGVEVDVNSAKLGMDWSDKSKPISLNATDFREFQLGTAIFGNQINPGNISDITIYGFKLTHALLYTSNRAGESQVRTDGQSISDQRQFYSLEGGAFSCLLPFDAFDPVHRRIKWIANNGNKNWHGYGYFLHDSWLLPSNTIAGNTVSDLHIGHPGDAYYGRQIVHGPVYDFSLRNIKSEGGSQNLSAMNGAVGYPIKVRDCQFEYASDAAVYAKENGFWFGSNLTVKYYGRTAIRSYGSFITLRDCFFTQSNAGKCSVVFTFHRGFGGLLDNVHVNFEAGEGPTEAYVRCELPVEFDRGPHLTLRNFIAGTFGPTTKFVELTGKDIGASKVKPGTLLLENAFTTAGEAFRVIEYPDGKTNWTVRDMDVLAKA
jgi:hypothetical protein